MFGSRVEEKYKKNIQVINMIYNNMPFSSQSNNSGGIINNSDILIVSGWTRPSDWPSINEPIPLNEIKLIVKDDSEIAFSVDVELSGTYSVDWGDGNISNSVPSGLIVEHTFLKGSGTTCSEGYTTYTISIYNATNNINSWNIKPFSGNLAQQNQPYLSAHFNCSFTSLDNMFYYPGTTYVYARNLRELIIENINSNCNGSTSNMLKENYKLTKFYINDLGSIDNMSNMFENCYSLYDINTFNSWGIVTNTSNMFLNCYSLNYFYLPNSWGSVDTTSNMFTNCISLRTVGNIPSWGNVMVTSSMFEGCSSILKLTLPSSWGSVTTIVSMFKDCTSLTEILNFPVSWGNVYILSNLFYGCESLVKITLPNTWNVNVSDLSYFFYNCKSLVSTDIPISWPTTLTNINSFFSGCNNLTQVTLPSSWNMITNIGFLFKDNYSLLNIVLPNSWGNVTYINNMFYSCKSMKSVSLPSSWGSFASLESMFNGCTSLSTITLPSSWGGITSVNSLFNNCKSLTNVFNMPSSWGGVQDCSYMFQGCSSLTNLTLPNNWSSSINYLTGMFLGCNSLYSITLPYRWTISNLTNMFQNCYSLKKITYTQPVSGATNTSVTFDTTFSNCYNIESLSIENPINVISMDGLSPTNRGNLKSISIPSTGSTFSIPPYINVAYTALDRSALESLFNNIPYRLSTKYIYITGCIGNDSVSLNNVTSTANSTLLTLSNTYGLTNGMEINGMYINPNRTVTFTSSSNNITYANHQLPAGQKVSFTTTLGNVFFNTTYYVVNPTTNTFQVSDTLGGSPITITVDNTTNMRVYPKIVNIVANTSITIDVPAVSSGTSSSTVSLLNKSIVLLKGWTIY